MVNAPPRETWPDDRIGQLAKLWSEGLTASQIAERMGGISRNSVIGKAHRLGLKARACRGGRKAPPPPSQDELDAAALAAETAEAERLAKIARARAMAEARRQAKAARIAMEAEAERQRMAAVVEQAPGLKASIDWIVEETATLVEAPKVLQFSKIPKIPVPVCETPKAEPARRGVSIFELCNPNKELGVLGTCRWPLGGRYEPAELFCGAEPLPGRPYCLNHCKIGFHPVRPRIAAAKPIDVSI